MTFIFLKSTVQVFNRMSLWYFHMIRLRLWVLEKNYRQDEVLFITSFQEVHDIQLAMLTLFTRLRQMRCLKPTWYLESKVREAGSVGQVLNQIEGIQDELLN